MKKENLNQINNKKNNNVSNNVNNKSSNQENFERSEKLTNKEVRRKMVKSANMKTGSNKWIWPLKVLILSISLSVVFSIASEFLISAAGITVSILVVLLLVIISIVFDGIGVSVTVASAEPFNAMSARKVKGAKEALTLVKNADKVAVVCNDIIGDICGIVSGAAGAAIAGRISAAMLNSNLIIMVMVLTTSSIAGITISGKALGKVIAINKSEKIVLQIGKILSPIWKKPKSDKQK